MVDESTRGIYRRSAIDNDSIFPKIIPTIHERMLPLNRGVEPLSFLPNALKAAAFLWQHQRFVKTVAENKRNAWLDLLFLLMILISAIGLIYVLLHTR